MNNASDSHSNSNNAFPFNFSNGSYCQNIPSAASRQVSMDQSNQLGGVKSHNNLVQSLFQGASQLQAQNFQDVTANSNSNSSAGSQAFWQGCRFCQQKYYHEISCPMHLQVQQFLQQQQQQQQNDLQLQLQMQHNQLQQQFNQQQQGQNQVDLTASSSNAMFGDNGLSQFMSSNANAGNVFQQVNDLKAQAPMSSSQNQGLNSLLQQQKVNAMEQQLRQVSSLNNKDQFESAIDNLPSMQQAFPPQQQQQQLPKPVPQQPIKPLTCSSPNSATDYFPLALAEDEEWLTPLHCFVRKYCVEVFVATSEDVAAPCMGKRNPVSVNQVGIRCPFCSPERMSANNEQVDVARVRENGVVYPSLISRIYNSSINLLQRHLRSCAFVPPAIITRYDELKSSNARSGASKKYWADSAMRLGLADTPEGIRLDKEAHVAHMKAHSSGEGRKSSSSALKGSEVQASLVLPCDKRNTTAFTFHLMGQMQPCVFTEADRLGRRRDLKVGFAGLGCRHCFGAYGSGRFFPSSVKTMADASKTLDVIYRHVMKCKNCPPDIRGGLTNLRDFHDSERSKMPFGNQRAFFVKIWGRLHEGSADLLVQNRGCAMALPSSTVPASPHAVASNTEAGLKSNAGANPDGESLQGLYALVKIDGDDEASPHNKLVTEAA